MAVILETSLGDLTIDLYTEERPRCCKNFLKLCKIKYYNWNLFHSIQRNLVAQTGDPTGSGRGGDSIYAKLYGEQARYFEAEVKPRIKHKKKGTVSMVNNGSDMHGSQFFLTLAPGIDYLDGVHTVFGEVAEGFEVLDKINEAYVDEKHRPYKDIRIYHTVVLDDPFDDPPGLGEFVPERSPEPTKEQLAGDRIGAEEEIDDTAGKTQEEVDEMINQKEAKANAQLLEILGDLPDADVKPEDNVLFVCKLNPVTTDEDLEVIFSRFGTILSCEVIKDHKTEESLQYAFIEFEKVEDCENAYFKMDNVLIDDRRIHVDFSQSVAKLKNKFDQRKGRMVDMRQQYALKDEKRRGGSSKYDFVFSDDEESAANSNKKEKKKQKKHKSKRESDSNEDGYRNRHIDSRKARGLDYHREVSDKYPEERRKYEKQRRDRSRSRDRRRSEERDSRKRRDRSRSREKSGGKKHKKDRYR